MGAVASKTVADLRRRRLQTIVLAVVLFLGAGAATLALSILVETNEPFDHAFAAANGAHLVIDYDAADQRCPARGDEGRQRCHVQRRSVARHACRRGGEARPDRQPGRVRTAHAGRHDRPGDHHRPDGGGRRPVRSSSTRTRPRCSAPSSVGRCRSMSSRRSEAREPRRRRPAARPSCRPGRARAPPRPSRHGRSRWSASPRRSAPRTSPPG